MNMNGPIALCMLLAVSATFLAGDTATSAPGGTTYYVSSLSGDDTAAGTSADGPWKTLARVQAVTPDPGDRILFKGGERFPGTLSLREVRGSAEAPILLSSYGEGRATIDAGRGTGFRLQGCEFVRIERLDFVGSGRKQGNDGSGIRVEGGRNVSIDAVDASGFRHAGVSTGGDESTRITNVHAFDNGFAGISVLGGHDGLPLTRNLYVGHCIANDNPGDPKNTTNHSGNGIVVGGLEVGLIEYSEAYGNGWDMPRKGNGPVGIWGWYCDRLVIQHNVSHHNKTAEGAHDGGGFDLDGGATNSVLQYNLSYANHGTGYLLCQYPGAKRWRNNVCRYNISIDDGRTNHFSGIHFWAGGEDISNAQVHNNLIINRRHAISSTHDIPGLVFRNNILVADDDVVSGPLLAARFEGNLYLSRKGAALVRHPDQVFRSLEEWAMASGEERIGDRLVGLVADPSLVMPPSLEDLPTDPRDLEEMRFYKLLRDSPGLGAAVPVEDHGGRDFWGNPVDPEGPRNIGPYEGPPTSAEEPQSQ